MRCFSSAGLPHGLSAHYRLVPCLSVGGPLDPLGHDGQPWREDSGRAVWQSWWQAVLEPETDLEAGPGMLGLAGAGGHGDPLLIRRDNSGFPAGGISAAGGGWRGRWCGWCWCASPICVEEGMQSEQSLLSLATKRAPRVEKTFQTWNASKPPEQCQADSGRNEGLPRRVGKTSSKTFAASF
jgi:hypothetical protein